MYWMDSVKVGEAYTNLQSFFRNSIKHSQKGYKRALQFSSVQSLSCVRLSAIPWIAALQASLSITNSRSSLRLTSIESVMPSSNLILCHPLLLLPPIPPSIRVFSNESALRVRWPKYWSFRFSIIPPLEVYIMVPNSAEERNKRSYIRHTLNSYL